MFDALARLADRRHRLVLVVAAVFVLFAAAFGGPLVTLLDSGDDFEDHASESVLARDAVERASGRSGSPDLVVLVRLGGDVDSAASQAKIARVAGALRDPGVADVAAYRDGRPEALVSATAAPPTCSRRSARTSTRTRSPSAFRNAWSASPG